MTGGNELDWRSVYLQQTIIWFRGDSDHKLIHLECPAAFEIHIGGVSDIQDVRGAGTRDVVEICFVSTVKSSLGRKPMTKLTLQIGLNHVYPPSSGFTVK